MMLTIIISMLVIRYSCRRFGIPVRDVKSSPFRYENEVMKVLPDETTTDVNETIVRLRL